jgi:hypothetical protein
MARHIDALWPRQVAPPAGNVGTPYVPPSRKNRRFFTTWQEETALSELRGHFA